MLHHRYCFKYYTGVNIRKSTTDDNEFDSPINMVHLSFALLNTEQFIYCQIYKTH